MKSTTYKGISRFRSGADEVKEDHRSGKPSTSVCVENIDAVRSLILTDRRMTESVTNALNIVGSAYAILMESLGLSKPFARRVTKLSRPDQQQRSAILSTVILYSR